MTTKQGVEVVLFPWEYMYMSQDEGGDTSHIGTYNLDFLGWGENGRVYQCPFYAPCTLRCVAIWDPSSNTRVWQSVNEVLFADGHTGILTISFSHDDNPIHNVGDIVAQGELLGHTGNTGISFGDHCHTCTGSGAYSGFTQRGSVIIDERVVPLYDLTNRCHYWDACFVNDTTIVEGYNHPWLEYQGGVVPPSPSGRTKRNGKFPWVLYANKLRNN